MTINGLKSACNQKTSRNPVVNYDEDTIIRALSSLKGKGLANTDMGGGSRATKYRHTIAVHYSLDPADLAILCLLLLRGPLTAGEINSNSGRLYPFDSLEEVNEKLEELSEHEPPFVKKIGRRPGQKENRFIHLLSEFDEEAFEQEVSSVSSGSANSRIQELEERVEKLEAEMERLRAEWKELMG